MAFDEAPENEMNQITNKSKRGVIKQIKAPGLKKASSTKISSEIHDDKPIQEEPVARGKRGKPKNRHGFGRLQGWWSGKGKRGER